MYSQKGDRECEALFGKSCQNERMSSKVKGQRAFSSTALTLHTNVPQLESDVLETSLSHLLFFRLQVFYKVLDVPDMHSMWKGNVVWTEM